MSPTEKLRLYSKGGDAVLWRMKVDHNEAVSGADSTALQGKAQDLLCGETEPLDDNEAMPSSRREPASTNRFGLEICGKRWKPTESSISNFKSIRRSSVRPPQPPPPPPPPPPLQPPPGQWMWQRGITEWPPSQPVPFAQPLVPAPNFVACDSLRQRDGGGPSRIGCGVVAAAGGARDEIFRKSQASPPRVWTPKTGTGVRRIPPRRCGRLLFEKRLSSSDVNTKRSDVTLPLAEFESLYHDVSRRAEPYAVDVEVGETKVGRKRYTCEIKWWQKESGGYYSLTKSKELKKHLGAEIGQFLVCFSASGGGWRLEARDEAVECGPSRPHNKRCRSDCTTGMNTATVAAAAVSQPKRTRPLRKTTRKRMSYVEDDDDLFSDAKDGG